MYLDKIADHALTRPNTPALSQKIQGQWQQLSWADLWQQMLQIAAHLRAHNIAKGDRVAILSTNSIEWTLVDLACIYIGAVTVPVYPTSTTKQINFILEHSDSKLVFVEPTLMNSAKAALVNLAEQPTLVSMARQPQNKPASLGQWLQEPITIEAAESLDFQDLLTIVYTSGTTGQPKGVMLTHGNLAAAIDAHLQDIEIRVGDRSLAALPLSHIFERGWSYILLFAGGHNHYLADISELQTALQEVKPQVFCAVPRIFEKIHTGIFQKATQAGKVKSQLLNVCAQIVISNQKHLQKNAALPVGRQLLNRLAQKLVGSKIRQALGGEIRFIPCGGAALDADIHAFFMGMGVNLKIGYGMTETLATVSFMPDQGYRLGTLGRPMAGIGIKISEQNSEILVRSPSMTPGYFRDPTATAELYENGWLKTGDAGYLDDQGNLIFKERIKELMKTSGGKYIAPQHVEGVLTRENLFEQVAIIADARNYASALIVPAWEALEEIAHTLNVAFEDRAELIRHSAIIEAVETRLHAVQAGLARYEQVKKFTLLPREFSIELGEITPTLKLRRKIIAERFKGEIAAMYS